jgi:hypothetical protein
MHKPRQLSPSDIEEAVTNLRRQLAAAAGSSPSGRIDCSPETIEQGLAKLVLSLIELLRQLLERQAIRRMEGGSLTDEQAEQMGEALMKLEAKIGELASSFGLTMADLNLDLGPLGNLLEK